MCWRQTYELHGHIFVTMEYMCTSHETTHAVCADKYIRDCSEAVLLLFMSMYIARVLPNISSQMILTLK